MMTTPGGNGYADEEDYQYVTAALSRVIALSRDARDREMMAEFSTGQVRFSELLEEMERLRAVAGLSAESPADGAVSALVADASTLTRAALTREVSRLVSPLSRPSATGGAPAVAREVELIEDGPKRTGDGAKFLTILDTLNLPGSWPDRFLGYCSGHNSAAIWLLTAPTPLGPWAWVEPVLGVAGSGARLVDPSLGDHAASPSVIWHAGKVHLYYHGPTSENGLEQPTSLATSQDGRAFSISSAGSMVIPTEYANQASPYRTSTSYAQVVWAEGQLHAVWQGTTGRDAVTPAGRYTPMPVGYGTSVDGVRWVKRDPIIYSRDSGQGLMAPGLARLNDGWIVAGSQRDSGGGTTGGQIASVGCYLGPSLDRLHRVANIVLPGVRTQFINSPVFITWEGRMWMVGGVHRPGTTTPVISAFELDWSRA